jgi:hypothetical protein
MFVYPLPCLAGKKGTDRGKIPPMGEDTTLGNDPGDGREIEAPSGWVTTKQAARALGISPRTIRWHIEQGNLEAELQGEGVKCTWLVSIDSLQAYRATRQDAGESPGTDRAHAEGADIAPDSIGNSIRELADRLVEEAARAAEYRVRLELTEQAQSTLETELATERLRREQAESERDALAAQLAELETSPESSPEPRESAVGTSEERAGTDAPSEEQSQERRSSWWRRFFGFENPT